MSKNCIFCKIISGEIPSKKIFENENFFAFNDVSPQAPQHILIVPKKHFSSLNDLDDSLREKVLPGLYSVADTVAQELNFRIRGYRTVINNQSEAGQTVFHLHMHVLAGSALKGGFGA